MARPRKGKEKNRPCRLAFLTSEAGREAIVTAALAGNKSISDIMNELIEKEFLRNPESIRRAVTE
jgi:hypothetical protein